MTEDFVGASQLLVCVCSTKTGPVDRCSLSFWHLSPICLDLSYEQHTMRNLVALSHPSTLATVMPLHTADDHPPLPERTRT
jgi:hypothetical protein